MTASSSTVKKPNIMRRSSTISTTASFSNVVIALIPFDIQIALLESNSSVNVNESLLDQLVAQWMTNGLNQSISLLSNQTDLTFLNLALTPIGQQRQLMIRSAAWDNTNSNNNNDWSPTNGRNLQSLQQVIWTVSYEGSTDWLQSQQPQNITSNQEAVLAMEDIVLSDPQQTLLSTLQAASDSTGLGSAVSAVQAFALSSSQDPTRSTALAPSLTAAPTSSQTAVGQSASLAPVASPAITAAPSFVAPSSFTNAPTLAAQIATSVPTKLPGSILPAASKASAAPTKAPAATTLQPSQATVHPTATQTTAPTKTPSSSPTFPQTTAAPSATATTLTPSVRATTVMPSATATTARPVQVTNSPTITSTTIAPSLRPTEATGRPTIATTLTPSESPTGLPATRPPTFKPSIRPTLSTRKPTRTPTRKPTSYPTLSTKKPTHHPTSPPTPLPTTLAPTITPSSLPTVTTGMPTAATQAPSGSPTGIPTTLVPSTQPSQVPTLVPTMKPTQPPTRLPTKPPSHMPTKLPTDKPSHAPTQPSHAPSFFPSEMPSYLTDSPLFQGLNMTLYGLRSFSSSAEGHWTTVTQNYIMAYFQNATTANVTVRDVVVTYQSSTLSFSSRRSLQTQGRPSIIVSYNQEFQYKTDSAAITPGLIVQLPFDGGASSYIELLKLADPSSFFSLSGVSSVTLPGNNNINGETASNNSSGSALSKPAKIAIGVGCGVLCLAILVALFDYLSGQRGRRYKQRLNSKDEDEDDAPFTHLQMGLGNDEISTLEDPHSPANRAAAGSVAGYRDQSVTTVDYEYTKAYGGIGNKTVSSAGGTFGSNTHGIAEMTEAAASAGAAPDESFSDTESLDTRYRAFNPSVKEILVDVFAPPGKLGVVIDTPDDGAPVIHAIKDSSVIVDQIQVGDKLVAVDDQDVRSMSAIKVSKLISRASENPSRKLTVLRTIVE